MKSKPNQKEPDKTQLQPPTPTVHHDQNAWNERSQTLPSQNGGPHSFDNPVFHDESMQCRNGPEVMETPYNEV